MVYLSTKLGDFVRANVGIHIPAPWFACGYAGDNDSDPGMKNCMMDDG
jgi:hypothetical protein